MKKKKTKKLMSLSWSFLIVIGLCWILPVIILLASTGYFVLTNVSQRTQENIQLSVDNAVKMTLERIDASISSSLASVYHTGYNDIYEKYLVTGDKVERYSATQKYLVQQYRQDEKFVGTSIFYLDDPKTMVYTTNTNKSNAPVIHKANTMNIIPILSPMIGSKTEFFESNGRLYMMRNLLDSKYKPYAVLCMEISDTLMFGALENVLMATDVVVWLGDQQYHINGECDQGDSCVAAQHADILKRMPSNGNVFEDIDTGAIIYGSSVEDVYTLRYLIKVDSTAVVSEISKFIFAIALISIMIIPMMALVVWFFYNKINKPIKSLTSAAKEIEQGNFGQKTKGKFTSSEFRYLADNFDEMSDKLQNQFNRLYKEELALRDAKIMALQLQMNPHFLNNTLEIINWEARFLGDEKISRMLECLSVMLSATMDRKKQRVVHIEEELLYTDAYLYIISERMGKRLKVSKEIDERLLSTYVPRLILQPIIENAVEHGIQPLQEGEIVIRAYKTEENIILEVENDGIMTNEDEEKIQMLLGPVSENTDVEAENLGIRNVHQRLQIIYGEKARLKIKMNKNQHTLAQIIIPINQQEQ